MAVTRILNNQITNAISGNTYVGIDAGLKLQDFTVTGAKLANGLIYSSDLSITGNVTGGNYLTSGIVSSSGNVTGANILTSGIVSSSGNVTGANILTSGIVSATGNITTAGYLFGNGALLTGIDAASIQNGNSNVRVIANSNVTIGVAGTSNVAVFATTGEYVTGVVSATGTITGGNLQTSGIISSTGTATLGNVETTGLISATGNITGGNIATTGNVSTTGNIYSGNLQTSGIISSTGNINAAGNLSATGNVTGGNINTAGLVDAASLITSGNAVIGGDLFVNGNTTYINITDLNIEDPIIGLGRGPNNAPLTTNDGKDRGEQLWYFSDTEKSAFTGYDNNTGKLIMATDVTIANEIVSVNNYGTFVTGNIEGTSASVTGNVTGNYFIGNGSQLTGVVAANMDANLLTGNTLSANVVNSSLTSVGTLTSLSVAGTTTSGNVATAGTISSTGTATLGNVATSGTISSTGTATLGNVATSGTISSTGTATLGNVATTGTVSATGTATAGNINTAGQVSATGTITGGNVATSGTISSTGTATLGNVDTTGTVSATGTITGGNVATSGTISSTGTITGGNVATSGTISSTGTATLGNVATSGTVSATGNVTGNYFIGNGSQLTGVVAANMDANLLTGNTLSANVVNSSLTSVGSLTSLSVVGTATAGNISTGGTISATSTITGGNVATSGTISSTGNITGGNILTSGAGGDISGTGNITGGNLLTSGIVSATGNITTAGYFFGNGSQLTGIDATSIQNGTSNVRVLANSNVVIGVAGTSNVAVFATTGEYVTGVVSATGTITGGNLQTSGIISSTGTATLGNVATSGTVSATGTATLGNVATSGTVSATGNVTGGSFDTAGTISATGTATVGNVTTTGIVSATGNITGGNIRTTGVVSTSGAVIGGNVYSGGVITATGNATVGNVDTTGTISATGVVTGGGFNTAGTVSATGNVTGNYFIGNGSQLTGVVAANMDANLLTGNTLSANVVNSSLTSVGSLTSLSVVGTATAGNLTTSGTVSATGTITGGNVATSGTISSTGNITSGNILTPGYVSATGNVTGGNVTTVGYVSATGDVNTSGNISATGNVTGSNVLTSGIISSTGTATLGNVETTGLISAVGTITSNSNITGANFTTAGDVSATGNVVAGNVNTPVIYSSANLLITAGTISLATADSTVDFNHAHLHNIQAPQDASDAANKQYVDDAVSAGITIHTPVTVEANVALNGTYAQGGTTATVTDTIAGNTIVFSTAVSPQPNDQYWFANSFNGILANTAYFVVSAPNTSAAVLSTSYSGVPVTTITNGSSLTQGVRINSGIGATLTNSGANVALIIDSVPMVLTNRVLVYVEANAVHNGVYTVTNVGNATSAWQLTRSTDTDVYGPKSIDELDVGDYFFVQDGDTGSGESYVMTAPNGAFIIGYDNVTFTQFSDSQVYTANTLAGLSLTGTIFSAKVDNNTTAFDLGGNIIVKAGANLTTPNIGAATGTSLSTTGNVDAGNVNTNFASVVGNVVGGNITTVGLVSATGNVTGNYIIGNGSQLTNVTATSVNANALTGNTLSANVTNSSLTSVGTLTSLSVAGTATVGNVNTSGTVSATGTATLGNVDTSGTVSATGNITGGNISTAGALSSTGTATLGNVNTSGTVSATGNATAGNVNTSGTVSATGNVTGGNILTAGIVSATGNVTGNYFLGNGSQLTGVIAANMDANLLTGSLLSANVLYSSLTQVGDLSQLSVVGLVKTGNIDTSGTISSTGTITGGNIFTIGTLSSIGSAIVGNVDTSGTVSATGNITGGNISTAGALSSTGTATLGNVNTSGAVSATGNITGGNVNFGSGVVSGTGNIYANTIFANISGSIDAAGSNTWVQFNDTGDILGASAGFTFDKSANLLTVGGNIVGSNFNTTGLVSATGNVTGGNILTAGIVSATGNVTGNYFIGNGSQLTGIDTTLISNGNSNVRVYANSDVTTSVAGIANVVTVNTTGLLVTGIASASGNVTGANITTVGSVTGGNIVISGDNITDTNGRVNFNIALADVDFAVNGTAANVFYIDAGTNTASFGSSTQTAEAIVAFNTTNSVVMPVGNTAQRPATGVTGMLRFNTNLDKLEIFDADSWEPVGSTVFTVIADEQFTGDGSTVTFVLATAQTTNSVIVSINGVVQIPGTAYNITSGTNLTFTEAPQPLDAIDVRELTTTTTVTSINNSSGNAVIGTNPVAAIVDVTGNLIPVIGNTYSLGNATNSWQSLHVAGNTIYLGVLQLKQVSSTTFGVFQADGVTEADIAVGNVEVSDITSGTSTIGISGPNGNIYHTVGGVANVLVTSTTGVSVLGNVVASGDIVGQNVNSLSDATLKENVTPITNAGAVVDALDGVGYDWKDGSGHAYGLLAQMVELIVPEAVRTDANGIKSINYQMLTPFLIETIKELRRDVAELKTKINK